MFTVPTAVSVYTKLSGQNPRLFIIALPWTLALVKHFAQRLHVRLFSIFVYNAKREYKDYFVVKAQSLKYNTHLNPLEYCIKMYKHF